MPESLRSRLRPVYRKVKSLTWRYLCPVCNQKTPAFQPLDAHYLENMVRYGSDLTLEEFETLNFKNYSCPWCGVSDRDRLYALFLKKSLSSQPLSSFHFLDIAPSAPLAKYIKANYPIKYRSGDLHMAGVDDQVDITHMACYRDNSFDAFLCSHVLEHVDDDVRAMSELYRILKHGGWGITMVPISKRLSSTRENLPHSTDAERWKYYGQDDHVRIYTREGFTTRLKSVGFSVEQHGANFFGENAIDQAGIESGSILYVVKKT